MIKFDSLTLKFFEKEVRNYFINARVRKIQQPGTHELVFFMRNGNENRKFYINFHPDFHHICFMSEGNEKKRHLVIPKAAPMFCMLLRKYIMNAKITDINVPQYERIFEIYFEYSDELNEKSKLCLAVELMGKHSNVILYNYDTNVIIGCAHNVGSEKSRERELRGLLPYAYPPKQRKKNILKITKEEFYKKIDKTNLEDSVSSDFYYLTKPLIRQILLSANYDKDKLYQISSDLLNGNNPLPGIFNDYSEFTYFNLPETHCVSSINDMIDEYFAHHIGEFILKNLKTKTVNILKSKLSGLQTLKDKQTEIVNDNKKANEYKTKADLIMTYLYKIKSGDKSVTVYDFEGRETEIALDEQKSPTENANRYYNLYRKKKTASEYADTMRKETESQILYYEEQLFFAENSSDIDELNEIYSEITGNKETAEENTETGKFIEYEGYRIYYGKNKKQNDYILSKIASPEDIWFHPLNFAGSHVILKSDNMKEEVPENVILKAAQITKEYSSQKNNSKTCIIYTKRKYVKKAKNKQAFVTYKNEKEIVV